MKENWEIVWKDYYETLQVQAIVKPSVLKAAFYGLVRKYHPDINKEPEALNKMKDLNEAFEILNNPLKRAKYDAEYHRNVHAYNSYSKSETKKNSAAIWCRKWTTCPRCVGGNMYLDYNNIEWICLQCGYRFSEPCLNEAVSTTDFSGIYSGIRYTD